MNNPIELIILKYSMKIIKNATLQNLLTYTKPYASQPAPTQLPKISSWAGAGWLANIWFYLSKKILGLFIFKTSSILFV